MRLLGKILQALRHHRRLPLHVTPRRCFYIRSNNTFHTNAKNTRKSNSFRSFGSKSGSSKFIDHTFGSSASKPFEETNSWDARGLLNSNIVPVAVLSAHNSQNATTMKVLLIPINLFEGDDGAKETLAIMSILGEHSRQIEAFSENVNETSAPVVRPKPYYPKKVTAPPQADYNCDASEGNEDLKYWENAEEIDLEEDPAAKAFYNEIKQAVAEQEVNRIKTHDSFDVVNWNDSKNKLVAFVPKCLEEKLKKMAIASVQLAFEMDMTNVKDALLMSGQKKNSIIAGQWEPQQSLKNPILALTTRFDIEASNSENRVPLNFNALIQGIIEIDSSKYTKDQLADMDIPEFNDSVTTIAANICSAALQKGFPTDMNNPRLNDAIEEAPEVPHVICLREGDKGVTSPMISDKRTKPNAAVTTRPTLPTIARGVSSDVTIESAKGPTNTTIRKASTGTVETPPHDPFQNGLMSCQAYEVAKAKAEELRSFSLPEIRSSEQLQKLGIPEIREDDFFPNELGKEPPPCRKIKGPCKKQPTKPRKPLGPDPNGPCVPKKESPCKKIDTTCPSKISYREDEIKAESTVNADSVVNAESIARVETMSQIESMTIAEPITEAETMAIAEPIANVDIVAKDDPCKKKDNKKKEDPCKKKDDGSKKKKEDPCKKKDDKKKEDPCKKKKEDPCKKKDDKKKEDPCKKKKEDPCKKKDDKKKKEDPCKKKDDKKKSDDPCKKKDDKKKKEDPCKKKDDKKKAQAASSKKVEKPDEPKPGCNPPEKKINASVACKTADPCLSMKKTGVCGSGAGKQAQKDKDRSRSSSTSSSKSLKKTDSKSSISSRKSSSKSICSSKKSTKSIDDKKGKKDDKCGKPDTKSACKSEEKKSKGSGGSPCESKKKEPKKADKDKCGSGGAKKSSKPKCIKKESGKKEGGSGKTICAKSGKKKRDTKPNCPQGVGGRGGKGGKSSDPCKKKYSTLSMFSKLTFTLPSKKDYANGFLPMWKRGFSSKKDGDDKKDSKFDDDAKCGGLKIPQPKHRWTVKYPKKDRKCFPEDECPKEKKCKDPPCPSVKTKTECEDGKDKGKGKDKKGRK